MIAVSRKDMKRIHSDRSCEPHVRIMHAMCLILPEPDGRSSLICYKGKGQIHEQRWRKCQVPCIRPNTPARSTITPGTQHSHPHQILRLDHSPLQHAHQRLTRITENLRPGQLDFTPILHVPKIERPRRHAIPFLAAGVFDFGRVTWSRECPPEISKAEHPPTLVCLPADEEGWVVAALKMSKSAVWKMTCLWGDDDGRLTAH